MQTVTNVANFMLAKTVTKQTTHSTHYTANTGLQTGEVFVTDPAGYIPNADATLTSPKFKLGVKLSDGTFWFSDIFDATTVTNISVQKYVAPVAKVEYIGYNGTSGSIDAEDNNSYHVNIMFKYGTAIEQATQEMRQGDYVTGSSATQEEIAYYVATNLAANVQETSEDKFMGTRIVYVERVNSGTSVATSGGAFTVLKGSKYVTTVESAGSAADAGKYNTDGSTIVAGDYIRFGHATTKTYPVYKVVSISGGGTAAATIELDAPYVGESGSVAAASTGVIAAASVGADWGIKLTGNTSGYYSLGKFTYTLPDWNTYLTGWGTTTYTSTGPTWPSGSGKQVADLERQLVPSEGNWYFASIPAPTLRQETSLTGTYATIVITDGAETPHAIAPKDRSLKQLYIACEKGTGSGYTDTNTGLGPTLNKYASQYGIQITTSGSTTIATEINA